MNFEPQGAIDKAEFEEVYKIYLQHVANSDHGAPSKAVNKVEQTAHEKDEILDDPEDDDLVDSHV